MGWREKPTVNARNGFLQVFIKQISESRGGEGGGVCITASGNILANILASGNVSLKLLMAPLETILIF